MLCLMKMKKTMPLAQQQQSSRTSSHAVKLCEFNLRTRAIDDEDVEDGARTGAVALADRVAAVVRHSFFLVATPPAARGHHRRDVVSCAPERMAGR